MDIESIQETGKILVGGGRGLGRNQREWNIIEAKEGDYSRQEGWSSEANVTEGLHMVQAKICQLDLSE